MAKSEPRQTPMGKCGHKILRVKIGRRFEWRCTEETEDQLCNVGKVEFSHNKLSARGKSK